MNRFKKTAAWFFVIGMALAMSIGYTAGPEKNSGFNDNDKSIGIMLHRHNKIGAELVFFAINHSFS